MEPTVFSAHELTKIYQKPALDHFSLDLHRGQILGLIGKNGAGKTTLIRLITGQSRPSSGSFSLFGGNTEKALNLARRRLGCMVETPGFFPYLSAYDNLEFYRIQRGIPGRESVNAALRRIGLADAGKKKFREFSLGMKQRLGLGLALLDNPEFLVLDEPINGLDPVGIVEFREILLQMNRDYGTTILISSHILSELANLATDFAFIDSGRLIEQISAEEISARCRDCLEIKVNNAPLAATVLDTLPGADYEVLPDNIFRIYSHLNEPQTISARLVNGGVQLLLMQQRASDLEGYFLHLIGGKRA